MVPPPHCEARAGRYYVFFEPQRNWMPSGHHLVSGKFALATHRGFNPVLPDGRATSQPFQRFFSGADHEQ